jgi:hypothetical protein
MDGTEWSQMLKEEEVSGQWSAVIGEEVNIEHRSGRGRGDKR